MSDRIPQRNQSPQSPTTTSVKQCGRCLVAVNKWGDECGHEATGMVYNALDNDDVLSCDFHTHHITSHPGKNDYFPIASQWLDRTIENQKQDISRGIGSHASLDYLFARRAEAVAAQNTSVH